VVLAVMEALEETVALVVLMAFQVLVVLAELLAQMVGMVVKVDGIGVTQELRGQGMVSIVV
jgi:hypothetical protein